MDEENLNKLERITIRIFLIAVLIWITFVLYQSCSASIIFQKGSGNNIYNAETDKVEANDDALRLLGKGSSNSSTKTKDTVQTTKDTVQTISEIKKDTINDKESD
jgi:hypothetical protein